jgi:ubiquinone/menaquinone biosynthesis C-methylase UbiE
VEKAIKWLARIILREEPSQTLAQGLASLPRPIAMHVPRVHILATDISLAALKVAKQNAEKFHVHHRIDFLECDLLPQHIDPLSTEALRP